MAGRAVSVAILAVLLTSMLTLAFRVQATESPPPFPPGFTLLHFYDGMATRGSWGGVGEGQGETITYDCPTEGLVNPGPYPYEFSLNESSHIYLYIRHFLWSPNALFINNLTIFVDATPVLNASGQSYVLDHDCKELIDLGNMSQGLHHITMTASKPDYYVVDWWEVLSGDSPEAVVSFNETGIGPGFIGTVVTVDGKGYTANELPISFTWYDFAVHTFSYASPLLDLNNAIQSVWNSTIGLSTLQTDMLIVTGSGNVTADYVVSELSYVHDVAVTNVVMPFINIYQGCVVNIAVTVANFGNATENFTTALSYDSNVIGVQSVVNLIPNAALTLLFSWNTTNVPYSNVHNYTITAIASAVPDETDTSNNLLIGGEIQILDPSTRPRLKIVNPLTGDQWFNFTSPWKKVGDTFILNVTIDNVVNMQCWQVGLQWNTSLLEFARLVYPSDNVLAELEPGVEPITLAPDTTSIAGMVIFGASALPGQPGFNGSGVLAQVEFKILQKIGESDISFGHIDDITVLYTPNPYIIIPFTPVNAYYHCSENPMCADINNDGTVNMKDVMSVVQMFNSFPGTLRWNPRADIDGNGRIDMRDIVIIVLNFGKHV